MGLTGAGLAQGFNSYSVRRKLDIGFVFLSSSKLLQSERATTAYPAHQPSNLVGVVAERAVDIRVLISGTVYGDGDNDGTGQCSHG